jgi:hypothetical protein
LGKLGKMRSRATFLFHRGRTRPTHLML